MYVSTYYEIKLLYFCSYIKYLMIQREKCLFYIYASVYTLQNILQ